MNWTVYSYKLPLLTGEKREGLVIQISTNSQKNGWGEIAPFTGRSQETLEQSLTQLLQFLRGSKMNRDLFPSVQFGLESALSLQLEPMSAPLYAFLRGNPDEIFKQAEIAALQGYTTLKVKIASLSLQAAKEVLFILLKRFRLRIDCNSAFSFKEAMLLFSHFDKTQFDYIEDPTFELAHLPEFTHPFALDETVLQYKKLPLETYKQLYGFILKPTLLGGKKGCTPLVEFACKHHLKVVFSPTFESGLGLYHILRLAKHFNLESSLLGLDTHRYIEQDLLMPSINFSTPNLTILKAPTLQLSMLKEIAHGTCSMPII